MADRPVLEPTADHPITVESAGVHLRVLVGDHVVADTDDALVLRESSYPPVYYIPRADVTDGDLTPSAHTTYCPYKGEAGYHGLRTGDGVRADKVWFYDAPYAAVSPIAGHVAFYPDSVEFSVT